MPRKISRKTEIFYNIALDTLKRNKEMKCNHCNKKKDEYSLALTVDDDILYDKICHDCYNE